jgi:hypothetical protein
MMKEWDEMTTHQSVKQTNLKINKHRQALYDQIKRLGIKCLVPDWSDYKNDSGKATLDRHFPFLISGLNKTLQIATLQINK